MTSNIAEAVPSPTEHNHPHSTPLISRVMDVAPMIDREVLPGNITRVVDGRYSSLYVIRIALDKVVLVDGGVDKQAHNLNSYLEEQGLDLDDVEGLVLTHVHSDHVGVLKNELSRRVPVFVSREDSKVLSGSELSQGWLPRRADKHRLRAAVRRLMPEIVVDDEVIKIGQLTMRAIAVPGHTDGSLAWRASQPDQPDVILAGDALDFRPNGSVKRPPRIFSNDIHESSQSIGHLVTRVTELGGSVAATIPSHSQHGPFSAVMDFKPTR